MTHRIHAVMEIGPEINFYESTYSNYTVYTQIQPLMLLGKVLFASFYIVLSPLIPIKQYKGGWKGNKEVHYRRPPSSPTELSKSSICCFLLLKGERKYQSCRKYFSCEVLEVSAI